MAHRSLSMRHNAAALRSRVATSPGLRRRRFSCRAALHERRSPWHRWNAQEGRCATNLIMHAPGSPAPICVTSSARRRPSKRAPGKVLATRLAEWASGLTFDDLPADVVASTRLRFLDVIGLSLAGSVTAFGRSTRAAALAMATGGPSRLLGTGERTIAPVAAFANAA